MIALKWGVVGGILCFPDPCNLSPRPTCRISTLWPRPRRRERRGRGRGPHREAYLPPNNIMELPQIGSENPVSPLSFLGSSALVWCHLPRLEGCWWHCHHIPACFPHRGSRPADSLTLLGLPECPPGQTLHPVPCAVWGRPWLPHSPGTLPVPAVTGRAAG